MVYGRYKEIRNAAWQTLIDFNVRSLPVSISDITDQLGIGLIDNIKINLLKQDERGATIYVKKQWYIILDESEQVETQRFTAAHELAHILLGHILTAKAKYRTFTKRTEEEQAADMFAARLLAPACVLHEISACSAIGSGSCVTSQLLLPRSELSECENLNEETSIICTL